MDQSNTPEMDPPRVLDNETVICSNIEQVSKLYEGKNVMKGIRPASESEITNQKEEEILTFRIPKDTLGDFETMDESNQDLFDYMAFSIVMQYIEKKCLNMDDKGI